MADTITAEVFRFDPSKDEAPKTVTYEVPWHEYMTGLEVLQYIYDTIEPIAFDYNCHAGQCGRCGMLIDKRPALACWTVLESGLHTFEPFNGFAVVKDLIVDKSTVYSLFVDSRAETQSIDPLEQTAHTIAYEEWFEVLHRLNMCRECMCCYADCQAMNDPKRRSHYAGPGAMAQLAQRVLDPNDQSDRIFQAVTSGMYQCYLCGNCDKVCPAGIPHMDLWAKMRKRAEDRGLKPKEAPA